MSKTVSRRGFISGAAAIGAGAVSALSGSQASAFGMKTDAPHPEKCFMDQYYDGILKITQGLRDTQIGNISKAMEKAYELKNNGGEIYCHQNYGHYSMFAGSRCRPGQPWVLPQGPITPPKEQFDAMEKGDFLITNRVDAGAVEAKKRGVYIVGVTNNYFRFNQTPENALVPGRMATSTEQIADLVIDSQVPWYNGLVSAPQIPHFRLCPSTGIGQFLVYWACTASLANLIGTKGKGSSANPVKQYLDLALERFRLIGTDRPKIDRIAEKWADLVLGKGSRLLVYGHDQDVETYGATGTRNIYVNDAVICSSSSMIAEPYAICEGGPRATDIVLIGAFTSDNADEIRVAREARRADAYTVAFCPYGTDGDYSGDRLFKEVDVAFNSYCEESEGVVSVKGFDEKVSPLAGLAGNLIHWMLTAQWTDHMARRGEMPYYWQGYHETGGQPYDLAVLPYYKSRGY